MPDKAAVRAQAAAMGLAVADKPDSQDICFVPTGRYDSVVAALRPDAAAPGDIVTADGAVLARHAGVGGYTVGQARRLGDAGRVDGQRQVVLALDAATRRVIVGPRQSGTRQVTLQEVNWLVDPAALRCQVKLRARGRAARRAGDPDGVWRDGGAGRAGAARAWAGLRLL